MRAIILAAGVGRRLGSHGDGPKCLLQFGGRSLLDRHISNLLNRNIADISVCIGYQGDVIVSAIRAMGYGNIQTIVNPDYREGSIVSLWATAEVLRSGEDIILMDADVLYANRLMDSLFQMPLSSRFLCDRDYAAGDEPVKICLRRGRIVEFRKRIAADLAYNDSGESVGFFSLTAQMAARLADTVESYVSCGRREEPYEEAIRDVALAHPGDFKVEDVTGIPWIEIDFPEDITRASEEILPQIDDN